MRHHGLAITPLLHRQILTIAPLFHGQKLQAYLLLDLAGDGLVLLQEVAHVVLALPDALALVAVPGAGLLDDPLGAAELDDLALAGNANAVHDLKLGFAKRRRNLVLHHLDAGHIADDFFAILDRTDLTDVEAYRRIELERIASSRCLGAAKHHADLHANLVDEDDH